MKRLSLVMTLLAVVAVLSGPALSQTTPVFEDFLCYYVPNQPVQNIHLLLQDQFDLPAGAFESTTQVQLMRFCNPAIKFFNGVTYPIGNVNHHLAMYQLNPQPSIPRAEVITNQFGSNVAINTSDARAVLVPTGKGIPPNSPPSPSPDLDHYKCYVASGPNANARVLVTDQFNSNVVFFVVQPVLFCNPVIKINAGVTTNIQFPNEHLTCYAITPTAFSKTINIANQFIPSLTGLNITVNNPDMLCAPTTKISWQVVTVPPATSSSSGTGGATRAAANRP